MVRAGGVALILAFAVFLTINVRRDRATAREAASASRT
jgi:hypothetical protein